MTAQMGGHSRHHCVIDRLDTLVVEVKHAKQVTIHQRRIANRVFCNF